MIQIALLPGFKFVYLLTIYERTEKTGILDETEPNTTSLMYALDRINKEYGNQTNIKITAREDIKLFKGWELVEQCEK